MTQRLFDGAMSTHTVAKCIHHVLGDMLHALMHTRPVEFTNVSKEH